MTTAKRPVFYKPHFENDNIYAPDMIDSLPVFSPRADTQVQKPTSQDLPKAS